jgi:hypothetical protein
MEIGDVIEFRSVASMEGSGSPSKSRQTANVFDIALLIAGWAALIRCSDVGNCHVTYEARTGSDGNNELAAAGWRAGALM